MARRNQPPDRLPEKVRDHPEVARACREWNIGRLFRFINNLSEEPAKFTVTHIGRLCGLSVSRVGEYMNDTHRVTAMGIIERIADGLHIPGERFGLVPRPWENETAATTPAGNVAALATNLDQDETFRQGLHDLLAGDLWTEIDLDRLATLATLASNADVSRHVTLVGGGTDSQQLDWQVSMAARRALRFSAGVGGSNIGTDTLDELASETRRIATEYQLSPIHTVVGDLVNLQDVSFRLLEGRQRPNETRDLYVLAGIASGMMANASHDLGDNHAALMQARTAYVCADNAGHDGLRAWVRGIQSMISYWAGWTHDAVKLADLGAEPASRTRGTVSAWIPALQARAWAVLGNAEEVGAAIQRATAARERVELNSFDVMGGKLTFPLARQLYYAADASSWLAGKERATSDFATSAISSYEEMPASERSYVDETIARTDLALAWAHRGALDGVQDAISPVLELTPSERIGGVIVNAVRVGAALREDRYQGAPQARQLVEELEDFTQMTAAVVVNR